MKKHISLYLITAWMGVVPLFSSISIAAMVINYETTILSFQFFHWLAFFASTVLSMAFAITPTTFIALVSGYFIGFDALIPIVISYQLASILGYWIASKLDNGFLNLIKERYPKSEAIIKNVSKNQLGLTILSRLSPALPFAIMNIVLSVSRIKFSHFFLGGLFGMLPRTVFFIWVGIQASHLSGAVESNQNIYWSLGLSAILIFVIYKILKR